MPAERGFEKRGADLPYVFGCSARTTSLPASPRRRRLGTRRGVLRCEAARCAVLRAALSSYFVEMDYLATAAVGAAAVESCEREFGFGMQHIIAAYGLGNT